MTSTVYRTQNGVAKKTYRICPKYLRKVFYEEERGDRENTETVMRMEGDRDNRSGDVSRPCAYAGKYSAKDFGVIIHGMLKGEK